VVAVVAAPAWALALVPVRALAWARALALARALAPEAVAAEWGQQA